MKVEGENAKLYVAVRLDSYLNAHQGELVLADEDSGEVRWKDKTGEEKRAVLGAHAIRIRLK